MVDFSDIFGNMGGDPRGGRGGHRHTQPDEDVDTTSLYEVLGVKKDADTRAIKKGFQRMAMKHHPDRGGDAALFKEANEAYEILGSKEKRELYDKYGKKGVDAGGPPQGGGSSIFDLFNGGGGGGGRAQKKKGQNGVLSVDVTLEDLYKGATKKAHFQKQFLCDECQGQGGKNVRFCGECNGKGSKMVIRQLGPNMIQQMQTSCNDCGGQGEIMDPRDRCRACSGKKVRRKLHEFDVHINKGTKNKKKILFREMGDQAPGIIPGDVYAQLNELKHDVFHREGAHLFIRQKISLIEAITGFEFTLQTLDDRTLIVQSLPDVYYGPGSVRAIRDEGMPQEDNIAVHGNLYVTLDVEWPKKLDIRTIDELTKLLDGDHTDPSFENVNMKEVEDVDLLDVNKEEEKEVWKQQKASRKHQKGQLDEDDEDDQPRGGGHQAQCQTQ